MKAYRLLTEYPESLKKGTIFEKNDKNFDYGRTIEAIFSIKTYPHLWEELDNFKIIEIQIKGDTVLTYDGEVCINRTDGMCPTDTMNLEDSLRHWSKGQDKIWAVVRVSDGEVFRVGDYITTRAGERPVTFNITEFRFSVCGENILALGNNGGVSITKVDKAKKPLFRTADGVDIFEKEPFYLVDMEYISKVLYCIGVSTPLADTSVTFSTLEAANKYAEHQTKNYSIADIKKELTLSACTTTFKSTILKNLTK